MLADFLEGFRFDLADTFAGDAELLTYFFEGVVGAVEEAVSHFEDFAFFF